MNRNFRHIFLLFLSSAISISVSAFSPKLKPGVNDKTGSGTGTTTTENTDLKLPVGIPFQLPDQTPSSGTATDNGGVHTGDPAQIIYSFDLPDGVAPESIHETHTAFQQARSLNAACVLIHMNSFSNALDAADNINSEMMFYDRPVMVYVNNRAIPASYLISMAAENKNRLKGIHHSITTDHYSKTEKNSSTSKNSVATFSSKSKTASADYSSDENNFTMNAMTQNHFLNDRAGDLNDMLQQSGMGKFKVVHYSAGFFSNVIDWCMKPFASLLLILLIAAGMRIQLKSAFPGPSTFLLMVTLPLFAVPLYIGGLASALEIGTAFTLCLLAIGLARKKNIPIIFKLLPLILFIATLALCQTGNFGIVPDLKNSLIRFSASALVFSAGWMAPLFFTTQQTRTRRI